MAIVTEQVGAETVFYRHEQEIGRIVRFPPREAVRFALWQPALSASELREIAAILEQRAAA